MDTRVALICAGRAMAERLRVIRKWVCGLFGMAFMVEGGWGRVGAGEDAGPGMVVISRRKTCLEDEASD